MTDSPHTPEPEKKQSVYQTLLVVLALAVGIGGWVGYQGSIVHERFAVRTRMEEELGARFDAAPYPPYTDEAPSWLRRQLGDVRIMRILPLRKLSAAEAELLKRVFPEANFGSARPD